MQSNDSIIFLGDIHGHTSLATKIGYRNRGKIVVQVGDFGIGFGKDTPPQLPTNVRFIRGNHDNPAVCRKSQHYIEDGTVHRLPNDKTIMYVGGAHSIDKPLRTEWVDWWPDEECSIVSLNEFINTYDSIRPDIMVTHDLPNTVAREIFGSGAHIIPTRTSQAFDSMFSIHRPSIWVHGHWHTSKQTNILGCEFHSLGINESREIYV